MLDLVEAPKSPPPNAQVRRLSWLDALANGVAGAAVGRKRSRTRARLVLATAEVMAREGYTHLRIADIVQAADVSSGAFYRYFPDRAAAAREVLCGLLAWLYEDRGATSARGLLVERLGDLITALQANMSLVRALNQAVEVDPTMARRADQAVRAWLSEVGPSAVSDARPHPRQTALDLGWILLSGCVRRCVQRPLSRVEIDDLAGAVSRAFQATEVR